jgi:hypothetical protein
VLYISLHTGDNRELLRLEDKLVVCSDFKSLDQGSFSAFRIKKKYFLKMLICDINIWYNPFFLL